MANTGTPTNLWVDARGNVVDQEPVFDLQRAQQELLREMETTLRTTAIRPRATQEPFRPTIGRVRPAVQQVDHDFWGFGELENEMQITIKYKGRTEALVIPSVVMDDYGKEDAVIHIKKTIEEFANKIVEEVKLDEQG